MKKIVIIDYGSSNLRSVVNALQFLDVKFEITCNPNKILRAESIIIPGVGSFKSSMEKLNNRAISHTIIEVVKEKKIKILGICLGFQMMGTSSTEDGFTLGLNLIPGNVEKFQLLSTNIKIPHIGFNSVNFINSSNGLFKGFSKKSIDFYFAHSYIYKTNIEKGEIATCYHGEKFIAAYQHENIFGTQFHPEKSQTNGLLLLKNFLEI